jgi:hypothetical protein
MTDPRVGYCHFLLRYERNVRVWYSAAIKIYALMNIAGNLLKSAETCLVSNSGGISDINLSLQ